MTNHQNTAIMTSTNVIVIRGRSATNTAIIASILQKHWQNMRLNTCILDAFDVGERQFHDIYESNQYDYMLVTLLNGDDFRPPCLENVYMTIDVN